MGMITRCRPQHDRHGRYGKRGIRVCKRWRDSFENFLADMGPRPLGMRGKRPAYSLGRIDNDGPYNLKNCRWETWEQQQRNRSSNHIVTAFGRTMTIQDWAEEKGINKTSLRERIVAGWEPEVAMTKPMRQELIVVAFGRTQTLRTWSLEKGMNPTTVWCRIQRGWSSERALSEPANYMPNRRPHRR